MSGTLDAKLPARLEPAAAPSTNERWTWGDLVLLALILAVATSIRLAHVDRAPSFDELWHIATTRGEGNALAIYKANTIYPAVASSTSLDGAPPFWHVWTGMDGVLHPPGFVMALRVWRDVVGESDAAAHGFSITWSLVAIGFAYAAAKLAMDRWVAAAVALALACSQTQVFLAQEVRPYQMMNGIGAIAVWLMTRVEVRGPTRRNVIALGLITLPLQLTHYFAFGGAVAIAVHGLLRSRRERRWFVAALAASAAIFIVTWIPFAIGQVKDLSTGDAFLKVPRDPVREFLFVAAAPFRIFAERDYAVELMPVLSGVLFVLPLLLLKRFRPLLPWSLWLWGSLGALVVLDMARSTAHVAYVRYLSVATPAVPLLFAGTMWSLGSSAIRGKVFATLISLALAGAGGIYLLSKNPVPGDSADFSDIVVGLERSIVSGEAIVTYEVTGGQEWFTDIWLMTIAHSPKLIGHPVVKLTRPMSAEMANALGTRRLWLVARQATVQVDTLIPGARVIGTTMSSPGVMTLHIAIDSPATRSDDATTLPSR